MTKEYETGARDRNDMVPHPTKSTRTEASSNYEDVLNPVVMAVPLQLFADHCALALVRHIDQPRNLAKSVTVE